MWNNEILTFNIWSCEMLPRNCLSCEKAAKKRIQKVRHMQLQKYETIEESWGETQIEKHQDTYQGPQLGILSALQEAVLFCWVKCRPACINTQNSMLNRVHSQVQLSNWNRNKPDDSIIRSRYKSVFIKL